MILLLSIFSLLFTYQITNINLIKNRLDNTLLIFTNELPSSWIKIITIEGKLTPIYKIKTIKETSSKFLNENLKGYITQYKLSFYYFNSLTKEKIIDLDYTSGVKITFKSKINNIYTYQKSKSFEIIKG